MKIMTGNRGVGKTTALLDIFVRSGPKSSFVCINRREAERVSGEAQVIASRLGIPMEMVGTVLTLEQFLSLGERKLRAGMQHSEQSKTFFDNLDLMLVELTGLTSSNIYVSASGPGLRP